jgi:hypothetical protein
MTGINWPAFLLVLAAALVTAVVAVSLFSVGVRLLAVPAPGTAPDAASFEPDDAGEDDPTTPASSRPVAATAGAVVAFALAAAVAGTGVVLLIHH